MNLLTIFTSILSCDLHLAYRRQAEVCVPLFFFILVVSLFPLAVSPESSLLKNIAPGVIWIAALLGTLLGLNSLFYSDFLDGSLEHFLLSPYPLPWLVLAKVFAHWLIFGLPVVLVSPILAFLFSLPFNLILLLCLSLLMGTLILSLIGSMAISLTLGLRNAGVLLSILVLPLYIPVLIFGVGVVLNPAEGVLTVQIAWLGAFLFLSVSLCPWVTAFALRMSII